MVPVFDNKLQNRKLRKELNQTIRETIDRGIFILGENVRKFEEEFARYIGVKYAVGVASGTDAITLALLASNIMIGDEVIVPANCYPSVFAVTAIGAEPRLVDIKPDTFTIDPDKIESAIGPRTKAILPVHLYGQAADLSAIMAIGKKHKLSVIEDCAQSHGAEINIEGAGWKKTGSIGEIGCFSFYPTKNLGCFGDGGMVVTNDRKIAERVRLLRMYGEKSRYESILLGRNSRLDEIQAGILSVKLKYLDEWNRKRRDNAAYYRNVFREIIQYDYVVPAEAAYARHVYHLFVIRSRNRDKLRQFLAKRGIASAIHYPHPIHLVPTFTYLGYKPGSFPEAESASREIISLPMYPELTKREINEVITGLKEFTPIRAAQLV